MNHADVFDECKRINQLLLSDREKDARDALILLLDKLEDTEIIYPEFLNHSIRQVGLYPYMDTTNLSWQDELLREMVRTEVGEGEDVVFHREQARVLNHLLTGESLAISAPTSFGKSFIIDAYIRLKDPDNVVIIVPTIALTDETRRRLFRKYGQHYKIITGVESEIGEKNIFIFPQERALAYVGVLKQIDLLVIDEFYKASPDFDKERSHPLIRAILLLSRIAKQRYFLAPNISFLADNDLTRGMRFLKIDFNTVFTNVIDHYAGEMTNDEKFEWTLPVISKSTERTLVYAGTYANINVISELCNTWLARRKSVLLEEFTAWLRLTYGDDYQLAELASRGVGVHNGRLHRSLSQLQIRLFEEAQGLNVMVSTSSIIEGVNTSAQNVVIWTNKNGRAKFDNFTYKNIVGRSGRMFRHFIGNVYLLDKMPVDRQTELNLQVDYEDLCNLPGSESTSSLDFIRENEVNAYKEEMAALIGGGGYAKLVEEGQLLHSKAALIRTIASDIRKSPMSWRSLKMLNSDNPNTWDNGLYKALNYCGNIGAKYSDFVEFVKILSLNWKVDMKEIIARLRHIDVGVNEYFELEKSATYNLATSLKTINALVNAIIPQERIDVSGFVSKLSSSFLPNTVFQLEEYGIPRSLSRKIQACGLMDFEQSLDMEGVLNSFRTLDKENLKAQIVGIVPFEAYIIDYFYEGIVKPK